MRSTLRYRAAGLVGVGAVALAMIWGGVAGGQVVHAGKAGSPVAGGTMHFDMPGDFTNFDLQSTVPDSTIDVLENTYGYLIDAAPNGKLRPYLAQSWTVTPKSVTFKIRTPYSTCADGTKVTPSVIANSFRRLIKESPYAAQMWGPGPYTVSANNNTNTFTFRVGTAFNGLVDGFSDIGQPSFVTGVVCPAGLANPKLMATQTFGSGPYTVVKAVHGSYVELKLRKDFVDGPDGTTAKTVGVPSTVYLDVIPDATTAANLLLTGGLDVAAVAGPDEERLLANKSIHWTSTESDAMNDLTFNQGPGHATDDAAVRQALITAIDPHDYSLAADDGIAALSGLFMTKNTQCYSTAAAKLAPKPSIAAAQAVLANDGWTLSGGKLMKNGQQLTVNFVWPVNSLYGSGPEYIATQWTQMGVNVLGGGTDFDNGYVQQGLLDGNFDAIIDGAALTTPVAGANATQVEGPPPPSGRNFPRITDPVLVRDAALGQSTIGATSCKYWADFYTEMWKQWDLLPLDSPKRFTFARKSIDLSLAGQAGTLPIAILVRRTA